MGLMARAARMAARQGREAISEDDIYAAMENKAMEAYAVSISCCSVLSLLHTFIMRSKNGVSATHHCVTPNPSCFWQGSLLHVGVVSHP